MTAPRTVTEALAAAAATTRGVIAIEHDGRSVALPYHQLLDDALMLAGALHACGLTAGDRVAIVLPEVSDFIQAFFGISAAGLVPVPLCPPAQAADLPTFARQSQHIADGGAHERRRDIGRCGAAAELDRNGESTVGGDDR